MWNLDAKQIIGLDTGEVDRLQELIRIYNEHLGPNQIKDRYYEGRVPLSEVNLGLALPEGIARLEIGCAWGAKCVDVLAGRSMFDGFVGQNGADVTALDRIVRGNRLIAEYAKACRDELKYGCTFATLSGDRGAGCRIRFHSPKTAAAKWSGEKGRLERGFAIIDSTCEEGTGKQWEPSVVNYYTETAIWVLRRYPGAIWRAEYQPQGMGRPLMEPLIWNATSGKPLGRSRIKEPVRRLIQGYVRTVANATIGLEFSTAPQKYMLGVTDEQYDKIVNDKFRQYVGSIIAGTTNPETGEKPTFGQLQQGTIAPHIEMLRALATQFSAATGLTVNDTGVVNDANPTSSDAILAQSQTLVIMAEQLNTGNGDALRTIAQMALAVAQGTTVEELPEEQRAVLAHFKNPAMPSIAATADAALKIASARQGFADTDTFLEMVGFDQAEIRRIRAQEQRGRGLSVLQEIGL